MHFRAESIVGPHRDEPNQATGSLCDIGLQRRQIADVLHQRFFDPKPLGQRSEDLLADCIFTRLDFADDISRTYKRDCQRDGCCRP